MRKTASRFAAGTGITIPALSYFTSYSPPLLPGISVLITAIAAAIAWIVVRSDPAKDRKRVTRWLIAAVAFLVFYALLMQFTTAIPIEHRLQIGFGLQPWSLTDAGRMWIRTVPTITVAQMLKNEAVVEQPQVELLWQTWSVYLAGLLLISLYALGFTGWTAAFAILAKQPDFHMPNKRRGD